MNRIINKVNNFKPLVIGLVIIIVLGLGCIGNISPKSGKDKKELPVATTIQATMPIQEMSSITPYITYCQKSSNKLYGGIGRAENNPPNGTVIDKNLTKYYGRLTATGICGTYQYISGWWFDDQEMEKLPFESVMYGESPYASDEGSGGSGMQEPIVPVSESPTLLLVAFGIILLKQGDNMFKKIRDRKFPKR